MSLEWIDVYIRGLIEHCYSTNVYEIFDTLNIEIRRVNENNIILQGDESVYVRDYFGIEVVLIRDDLPYQYEKFILAHELGHALLHVELAEAFYSKSLVNRGKLEKQADYFAIKLLNIKLDEVYHEGLTIGQIASDLCVAERSLECIYCR